VCQRVAPDGLPVSLNKAFELSVVGRESLALLVAPGGLSHSASLVLRQQLMQELVSNQKRFTQLGILFAQYRSVERSVLTMLEQAKKHVASEPDYTMMPFKLPGFASLKNYPFIKTVELGWSWFVRSYWLFFLSVATIQMALYGMYALATADGEPVTGVGLNPATHQEYNEYHGDYYMSLDTRFLWQFGPRKTKFRGALALISSVFAAAGVVREIKEYVEAYHANKREWKELSRMLYGLVVMNQMYRLLVDVEQVRKMPDCSGFFDFFEKYSKLEGAVNNLCAAATNCVFDADKGTHLFAGYTEVVKELLCISNQELSELIAGVGRIEAYWWCAQQA